MTPTKDSNSSWESILDSVLRRLDRLETKLDAVGEQVARIAATCTERGTVLKTLCKDMYGNGSPGLKTQASMVWMVVSGLGGGVVVLVGQLLYAAIAKAF